MRRNTFLQKIVIGLLATLALPGTAKVHAQEISRQQADSIVVMFLLSSHDSWTGYQDSSYGWIPWEPFLVFFCHDSSFFTDTVPFPDAPALARTSYAYFVKTLTLVWEPTPSFCLFVDKTDGHTEKRTYGNGLGEQGWNTTSPYGTDWVVYSRYGDILDMFWTKSPLVHITESEAETLLDAYLDENYGDSYPDAYSVYIHRDTGKNLLTWSIGNGETSLNFGYYYENTFVYLLVEEDKKEGLKYSLLAVLGNDPAIGIPCNSLYIPITIDEEFVVTQPFLHVFSDSMAYIPSDMTQWNKVRSHEPEAGNQKSANQDAIRLSGAVPNPFSTTIWLAYELPPYIRSATLQVFDLHGRLLQSLPLDGRGTAEARLDLSAQAPACTSASS